MDKTVINPQWIDTQGKGRGIFDKKVITIYKFFSLWLWALLYWIIQLLIAIIGEHNNNCLWRVGELIGSNDYCKDITLTTAWIVK